MTAFFRGVLRFRLLILAVAVGVLAGGIVQVRSASIDVLPEFSPPYAEIQTEALGLSAEEVEQLITVPLEADLLNGVEGVDVIRSDSVPGLSSIVLVFTPGTDIYRARQLVEERLAQAHALPNVSKPPTLLQPLSSSSRVLMIGMSTTELTPIEMSVIARWTVKPQLMGVPGVANVAVWGMRDQQLQVQVDPARLRTQKVTLNQVVSTAGNAQVVSPLSFLEASTPGTGGFIETPQQRLQVRHLLEKIADPAELAKVPVEGTDGRLRLGDVADIGVDHQPLIGDAVVGGGPGLVLIVEKFPGVSTPEVTRDVEQALERLRPGLTGITTDTGVFRPADYVEDGLGNLGLALLLGAIGLVLALVALRRPWLVVLITVVTIPLALATATLVLQLLGQSLNALVLAGLAAAVAVVVDDAIAPTEQVLRHLRHPRHSGEAVPLAETVGTAAAGARRPLLYATLVVALAIVPVVVLDGRPGAFFAPLALAYAVAVAAALLVALTVVPALLALVGTRRRSNTQRRAPSRLAARYEHALQRFSARRRPALLAVVAAIALSLLVLPFLALSLMPSLADRDVLVRLDGAPGTSNARMTEQTTALSKTLEALPGVSSVGAHVGRAETGDRVVNVSSSDIWVALEPNAEHEDTMQAIADAVRDVPGLTSEVLTSSSQEMRDIGALLDGDEAASGDTLDVLTGVREPVAVRLFGQDSTVLAEQAARVQQLIAGVDGVVAPRVVQPPTQPTIEIEVDLARAQQLGVSPGDVRRAEAILVQGIQVGSVFEDQKVFDVIVRGTPAVRQSVADIEAMLIDRPGGGHVRLGQVADVRTVQTPAIIQRDAVSRRIDVVAGVDGRSAAAVAADISARLTTLDMPLEYHAEVLQRSTADEVGMGRVIGVALAAVLAAFLLFQAAFRSWRLAGVLALSLPLALVGGVIGALLDGAELSLGSLLGFLAVLGLATRTGLAMISELLSRDAERRAAGAVDGEGHVAAVRHGARSRLAPVLASTLALALFALPFVVLGPRPGLEILHPLAVVLLGGLITSALVTLFLLPAVYLHVGAGLGDHPDAEEAEAAPEEHVVRAPDGAPPVREPARVGSGAVGVR